MSHEKPLKQDEWGFSHPLTNQFLVDGSKPGGRAFIDAMESDYKSWSQWRDIAHKAIQALLDVEHSVRIKEHNPQCPACGYALIPGSPHDEECPIDQALDAAGLDTQGKRDHARRMTK